MSFLRPLWRCKPNGTGVFTIALDPREAELVLARGFALLDGVRYRTSEKGWGRGPDLDGRQTIRCELAA